MAEGYELPRGVRGHAPPEIFLSEYRRIPVISPGLIQFRKGFWVGL